NLLSQQHTASTRFLSLADYDLDRIRSSQVIRVHAVARRQQLVDQFVRMSTFFFGHPAVTGGCGSSHRRSTSAQSLFGLGRKRPEAHPRNGNGDVQVHRLGALVGAKVTSVSQRSRYPSIGYREIAGPRNCRSTKLWKDRFCTPPAMT